MFLKQTSKKSTVKEKDDHMMRGGSYNRFNGGGSYAPSSYFSSNASNYYTPNGGLSTTAANSSPATNKSRFLQYLLVVVFLFVVLLTVFYRSSESSDGSVLDSVRATVMTTTTPSRKVLSAATWNIAAINNNPFEYWITSQDPSYNSLMSNVSQLIVSPGPDFDQPISSIFTEQMLDELLELLAGAKLLSSASSSSASMSSLSVGTTSTTTTTSSSSTSTTSPLATMSGGGTRGMGTATAVSLPLIQDLKTYFSENYAHKRIISEFIKDGVLGKKRLVSMPDRVTNTISTLDDKVEMRPTVINCFQQADLHDLKNWWKEWKYFFFQLEISAKRGGKASTVAPTKTKIFKLIQKIEKSKYPSITSEEEKMSIPLSILSLAIFDSILVHSMNHISTSYPQIEWQRLRSTMCKSLNQQKASRVLQILDTSYQNTDVLFLQEVAGNFATKTKDTTLANLFDIYQSSFMDPDRDQNSFVLLKKGRFRDVLEVTGDVNSILLEQSAKTKTKVPVVAGDLIVLLAVDAADKTKYILASFHGDTNG
jgi:hypothetical protein